MKAAIECADTVERERERPGGFYSFVDRSLASILIIHAIGVLDVAEWEVGEP
jgi:hypothetical protein